MQRVAHIFRIVSWLVPMALVVAVACSPRNMPTPTAPTTTPVEPQPVPPTSATPPARRTASASATRPSTATPDPTRTPAPVEWLDGPYAPYMFQYGLGYGTIGRAQDGLLYPRALHSASMELGAIGQERGPGDALALAFSHFSGTVAYWALGTPGQLWVSDLAYRSPRLVFTDTAGAFLTEDYPYPSEALSLSWSPDDQHLILERQADPRAGLIYHRATDTAERWDYSCDLVARSPRSGRWATWCTAQQGRSGYAVIEWGGEIWHSGTAPAEELVRRDDGGSTDWAWSADGGRLAYFQTGDPQGYLRIAEADGTETTLLPGSAYWLAERHPIWLPAAAPIQWSKDGSRLLVYAMGSPARPCPAWRNPADEDAIRYEVPCWQVLDSLTERVVWTLADSARQLMGPTGPEAIETWSYMLASISPDGRYLALVSNEWGADRLEVVSVDSGDVLWLWDVRFGAVHWGDAP